MNGKLVDTNILIYLSKKTLDFEKVISIRQQHKIKLPDAIILATAVISKMELITANVPDFANIDNSLKIYNPMD